MRKDGAPRLVATLRAADDGVLELVSPVVGYYRDARMLGELVGGGAR
ncbi:MAG: hypothetical protein H5U40_16470, partial [Polyangiaceae bacterium]|nr:hypothetical protein [Polyangiaceae bacterium]